MTSMAVLTTLVLSVVVSVGLCAGLVALTLGMVPRKVR
jgi:hypothetical protein